MQNFHATERRAHAASIRSLAGLLLAGALVAPALANPTPAPAPAKPAASKSAPRRQPPPMPKAPTVKLHSEFVVETNAKGQVARVRSGKPAKDANFNAMTYGNALQAFIRTPDDHAIAGVFRLSYDYDPKTQRVHRSVALIRAGGVNPKALGAVDVMVQFEKRRAAVALQKAKAAAAHQTPSPKSTANLPDLNSITGKH